MPDTLTILRYPHPVLASHCEAVRSFDDGLQQFADALYLTMRAAPGVGITAAHVGRLIRLVILDLPELGGRRDYVNPELLTVSNDVMDHQEGSVCMPGMVETVTRPRRISMRYQTLGGEWREEDLEDFPAICMQHEIDQLNGQFWINRLSRLKRERLLKKWQKAERA
ncbi:peptide deformylase [Allorhizobium taibaishanense]|uniref:Peptide deformylase-like n=1 Tax=Allorhizobium taibaishanense TaxID=887144 RepID=A0A1Q9A0S2_9HYPH|nr:peptide deformylase [Allorhizobium taibaishanense]MBB4007832.1 peptide deformylase [Allorhizobium taibaishanense]OLP48173.1 peptide deformylase [Allorhizobium taibaishanense]